MSDDLGTPAGAAAPAETDGDGFSPTMETGTQDGGSGPDVSTGGTESGDDRTALQERIAELEKRVSHGTRTYQELQQMRAEHDRLTQRLTRWKQAGVDPDEIDRALAAASGVVEPQQGKSQLPDGVLTQDQFAQYMVLREWETEKRGWFKQNPEFKTKSVNAIFDGAAKEKAEAEIMEFGRIVSTPDEIFGHALKEFGKFKATLRKAAEKELTEKRQKVDAQGVIETAHRKVPVERDTGEFKPKTPQEKAAEFRARQAQIRGR